METGILALIIGGVAAAVAAVVAVARLFLWFGNKQSRGSTNAIKPKPTIGKKNLPPNKNWPEQFTGNNNNNPANKQHNVFVPPKGTMYVPWVPIWIREQVNSRVH